MCEGGHIFLGKNLPFPQKRKNQIPKIKSKTRGFELWRATAPLLCKLNEFWFQIWMRDNIAFNPIVYVFWSHKIVFGQIWEIAAYW